MEIYNNNIQLLECIINIKRITTVSDVNIIWVYFGFSNRSIRMYVKSLIFV